MSDIIKKSGGGAIEKKSAVLDKIRAAKPAKPLTGSKLAPRDERRPRLVFAVDATASRQPTWDSAKQITDKMFDAIPGALDVALAVHGGSALHTFTDFSADVARFRDKAAAVRCSAGETKLCDIMERTLDAGGVKVMAYIGDAFEESETDALLLADRFKARGIKLVVLADEPDRSTRAIFEELARRTGGACLDFRSAQLGTMGEVLDAVAALAVGGRKLLEARRTAGSLLLLGNLKD